MQWNNNTNKNHQLCQSNHKHQMLIEGVLGKVVWLTVLTLITTLNITVMYASLQYRILRQNALHRIVMSNYAANLVFGISTCTAILISTKQATCIQVVITYCFTIVGGTAGILGAMSLSIMRIKQVLKIQVNNNIIKKLHSNKKLQVSYHLCFIWFTSVIVSIVPAFIDTTELMALPFIVGILSIIMTVTIRLKTYKKIKNQRITIRQSSLKRYDKTLLRTEHIIQSNTLMLVLAWMPILLMKTLIYFAAINIIYLLHGFICISILYPILHPILCVYQTKELKKYFTRFQSNCCKRPNINFLTHEQYKNKKQSTQRIDPFTITKKEESTMQCTKMDTA
ncbi:uncharacterized protein LOC130632707 [Hydractinia symbiolongicarpus]|uniref:uncharacterized protein LOC130632707 n=1 Tax=Hydractinia symbiolongicarpus TaxID=13093 RepID=UPI00254B5EAB|nr:uncharacterized protein LOC130632707 [Hydractinia symbiolongicarpus]